MLSINKIADQLAKHGWTLSTKHSAVKLFTTVDNKRQEPAILYCIGGLLTAEYRSEGRNVLSSCYGSISPNIDGFGPFTGDVEGYLKHIEEVIDQTYGRRIQQQT